MDKLIVSDRVRAKLHEKHGLHKEDVQQCFANRIGHYLEDTREDHKTQPPTLWFISENDMGVKIKVVFIQDGNSFKLKTAYRPNNDELAIYSKYAL